MDSKRELLKGCLSIIIPIILAVITSIIAVMCNKNGSKQIVLDKVETTYSVFKGKYDRFLNNGMLWPLPDSLRNKDHITEAEYKTLSSGIFYLCESDTLRVSSEYDLDECYMVFESTKLDTLDFDYGIWCYYACVSNHNTDYANLDKITFVMSESTHGNMTLTLSKEEFAEKFPMLIGYLKLKKH